ncbi:MAG: aldehyde dehydrogenase family protein [Rhodopila sp.]|nr:aldehyde dehydrogenase family protein [Rhodopila sp.]
MNVITQIHPFLDGKPKRMLIGGKWLEAASGKTFETRNPATGEILAQVAEGDVEDIDRAVAAAREAFNGPWSKFKPAERQRILLKLADLVERDIEEFAALDTLDMGAPITRTRGNRARAVGMLRFYAGMATALHGETINNSLPGEIVSFTLKGTNRRGWRDHPLERPADRVDLEDWTGAGHRLHRGAEARRGSPADAVAPG